MPSMPPRKRIRRSATAVMAGVFDMPPSRDVLTSLLNGVQKYSAVEKDEEEKRIRRKERKDQRKKARAIERATAEGSATTIRGSAPNAMSISVPPLVNSRASSFWKSKSTTVPKARPEINIASIQRSLSVTPPPMHSPQATPEATPGPSVSSDMSRGSLKRPYTPDDNEEISYRQISGPPDEDQPTRRERRKRLAAKKGWKGWVEGSPPPSEKLINLDAVPILQERRTRSGKNFDAIGVGKEGWV